MQWTEAGLVVTKEEMEKIAVKVTSLLTFLRETTVDMDEGLLVAMLATRCLQEDLGMKSPMHLVAKQSN